MELFLKNSYNNIRLQDKKIEKNNGYITIKEHFASLTSGHGKYLHRVGYRLGEIEVYKELELNKFEKNKKWVKYNEDGTVTECKNHKEYRVEKSFFVNLIWNDNKKSYFIEIENQHYRYKTDKLTEGQKDYLLKEVYKNVLLKNNAKLTIIN